MSEEELDTRNGYGFRADEKIYMVRCFECGRENWHPAVSSGTCAWCGFDANKEDAEKREANEA